jgi:multisubunit Na+/H+ antiporter MnhG subunit
MNLLSLAISIPACLLLIASALAFLRTKDVFTMTHVVMIANCYVVPLILIAIAVEHFSLTSLVKIIGLIVLNLIVANLLCYLVVRRATTNKIVPDAHQIR